MAETEEGRKAVTAMVTRGAARHLALAHGAGVVVEFRLADGRRLDLMAVLPDGRLWAVEVKSCREDLTADGKWPGYRDWCDALWFAVPAGFPLELLPEGVGILCADGFDAAPLREPEATPLHASRRKAVTLRLALTASRRLMGMEDGARSG